MGYHHKHDVTIHLDPEGYPDWLPDYAGNKPCKTVEDSSDNQFFRVCDGLDFILHFTIIVKLD